MFFILDGHHKFCAYNRSQIKPHVVIVTKQEVEYKSTKETKELAISMGCRNKEYLNWMEHQKNNLSYYNKVKIDLDEVFTIVAAPKV